MTLPPPGRKAFWLSAAFLVKGLIFLHMLGQPFISSSRADSFGVCAGDCESYLAPVDHLFDHGSYTPDFRMPGYGAVYGAIRLFWSGAAAVNALVLLQFLLDALATWLLAWSAYRWTGKAAMFYVVLVLYGAGCTVSDFDRHVLAESVSASLLVFAFHFGTRYRTEGRPLWLLFSGAFLVWTYFARPVMFGSFLLVVLAVGWNSFREGRRAHMLWFLLPCIIAQGAWSLRNRIVHDKWFLLTETPYYPFYPQRLILSWEFIRTFDDWKVPYLIPEQGKRGNFELPEKDMPAFPAEITTPEVTQERLLALRHAGYVLGTDSLSPQRREELERYFQEHVVLYTASVKKHHPFLVHVLTPLRRTVHHVFRSSGVMNFYALPFRELGVVQRLVKCGFIAIWLLSVYGAVILLLRTLVRPRSSANAVLSLLLLYGALVHPVIIGTSDPRYLYVCFPMICLAAGSTYAGLIERWFPPQVAPSTGVRSGSPT